MSTPKAIIDAITELRRERTPLAARLDAIDLAIDNLTRVYGISGIDQRLPIDRPRVVRRKEAPVAEDSDASARRDALLSVIGKSDVGLTLSELRKATPKMDGKDRSNAQRAGNAWKAA